MTMDEVRAGMNARIRAMSHTWIKKTSNADEYVEFAHENIPHSDANSAQVLYKTFKNQVHYVPGTGSWHVWNDVYHEKVDGDLLALWMWRAFAKFQKQRLADVKEFYKAQASVLTGAAVKAKMDEYEKRMFKEHREYRDKIHSSTGTGGLVTQIKREFSVEDSFFSNDRDFLVLQNGVIDLKELRSNPPVPGDLAGIKLLPHSPHRPVWRAVDASLDLEARADRWRSFLAMSLPDAESRKFLAVACGAAFLAESKTKIIPVLKGPKDSGKTIFLDTIDTLAAGYGGQPDNSAIVRTNGPNFEQDQLRGLRFVGISEPNTDRKVDDSFLKKFTGGDVLSTRNLHARSQEWKSQGVMFIASNADLKFNTNDKAILDRFATVAFPNKFYSLGAIPIGKEDYVKDQTLEDTLFGQLDGILSWVLNGMLVYLHEGIVVPASVERERERQYIEGSSVISWITRIAEGDSLGFVLEEDRTRKNSHYAKLGDAYMAYTAWCFGELSEEPKGKKRFSAELQEYLDVPMVESGGTRIPRLVYMDVAQTTA